jgi:hypothetical protein
VAQTGLQFDLRSAQGKLIASLMATPAEFERDLLRERVRSGIAVARSAASCSAGGEVAVLRRRDWRMIQERLRQGAYIKDVAAELGVHPRTVSRALKRGDAPPGRPRSGRQSKLDPYKTAIDGLLAAGVWNAVVILREIQEQGYDGRASILRDYIRPKRPLRQARATVRFETAPGEQLQNDWAKARTVIAGPRAGVAFRGQHLGLLAPVSFRGDGLRGRRTHLRKPDSEF